MVKRSLTKREKILFIIGIASLCLGVIVVCFPFVSDYIEKINQKDAVEEYKKIVSEMSEEEIDSIWTSAEEFNYNFDEESYPSQLKVEGSEVMAILEIPKLSLVLPIYHSNSVSSMTEGCGHWQLSSLPIGGTSTHCVLMGHNGLPSSELFSHIDELSEGDVFYITVLNKKLEYKVDKISTVLPEDFSELSVSEGENYCTLYTCTPYGINTHRLLVRGRAVEN